MKINTKIVLKNLNGEPLTSPDNVPFTLGEALGNIMVSHDAGGKMKCFLLAQKFATQDSVEVDGADLSLVKQACESSRAYAGGLIPGQALLILEELKEEKK
jgi:hypothetical protein